MNSTLRSTQYVMLIVFGITLLIASESDETEIRVVVFGKTGVGKSSLANTLLDTDEFQTGMGSDSITKTCQRVSKTGDTAFGEVKLSIVDTPGYTRYGNEKTAQVISSCVKLSLPGPHVFILVISVTQRFTEEDINTIEKQFGYDISEYMMVVFTSKTSPSEYIKHAPLPLPLRKTLAQCSNRYAFIDTGGHTSQKQHDVDEIMRIIGNIIAKHQGKHYTNQVYEEAVKRNIGNQYINQMFAEALLRRWAVERTNQMFDEAVRRGADESETELRVVVFGKTGVGKSSLANTLLDTDEFETSEGSESITITSQRHSRTRHTEFGWMKLSIVDTPGLFDTRYENEETAEEIGRCVELSLPGPHVFILVVSLADRFTEEDMKTVEALENQFGESISEYLMIVFTSKDRLRKKSPTEYIKGATVLLKNILAKCSYRHAFIDTEDHISHKQADVDEIMKIVGEIIEQNNGYYYTNQMYEEATRKRDAAKGNLNRERDEERQRITLLGVAIKAIVTGFTYWFYGWIPAVATATFSAFV